MPGVAAVAVDDDLAAGHAGVGARSPEHEAPGGVDVDGRLLIDHLRRHHLVEHELPQVLADALDRDVLGVLRRQHNGIDAARPPVGVLDGDLRLAVRPEVWHRLVLADARQLAGQLVGQLDRHRHQLGRLVAGEAEHHSLVAGAAGVNPLRDIR